MNRLTKVAATGSITTAPAILKAIVLAAGADAATVTVADGNGGTEVLTLAAPAGDSVVYNGCCAVMARGIHVTLTGTGPEVSVEWST